MIACGLDGGKDASGPVVTVSSLTRKSLWLGRVVGSREFGWARRVRGALRVWVQLVPASHGPQVAVPRAASAAAHPTSSQSRR